MCVIAIPVPLVIGPEGHSEVLQDLRQEDLHGKELR